MQYVRDVCEFLPPITSISGMVLYSLIVYVFTFAFSWLRVKIVNDNVDFGKSTRESILKNRAKKTIAAQALLDAMSNKKN